MNLKLFTKVVCAKKNLVKKEVSVRNFALKNVIIFQSNDKDYENTTVSGVFKSRLITLKIPLIVAFSATCHASSRDHGRSCAWGSKFPHTLFSLYSLTLYSPSCCFCKFTGRYFTFQAFTGTFQAFSRELTSTNR